MIINDGRTPWTSDEIIAKPLPKYRINAYTHQTPMPCVGFEATIPVSERAKVVHALDRSATVTGIKKPIKLKIMRIILRRSQRCGEMAC
jgi:hypothetical protein